MRRLNRACACCWRKLGLFLLRRRVLTLSCVRKRTWFIGGHQSASSKNSAQAATRNAWPRPSSRWWAVCMYNAAHQKNTAANTVSHFMQGLLLDQVPRMRGNETEPPLCAWQVIILTDCYQISPWELSVLYYCTVQCSGLHLLYCTD